MAERFIITGQRQVTSLDGNGRFHDAMEVSFQVKSNGVTGHVDIPLARYSPEHVQEIVGEYVDNIEAVHNL